MDKKIVISKSNISYKLIRKNVKNINLRITKELEIIVSANKDISEEIIQQFINSKRKWIYDKIKLLENENKEIIRLRKISETTAFYLGEKYRIIYCKNCKESKIKNRDLYLYYGTNQEEALKNWYIKKANDIFQEILNEQFYKIFQRNKSLPKMSIKNMRSRWGSCNKRLNKVNLNLKLIHQERGGIDYVITHELIHLKVANHSADFYNELEKVMPDYLSKKSLLKSKYIYI